VRYNKKVYFVLHVKYLLCLSDFNESQIFATDFQKIIKYKISYKLVQWKLRCSVWTDRLTRWS